MNNKEVERMKPTGKINRFAISDGLCLHVSPDATKKRFVYRYRRPGQRKMSEIPIGLFHPTTFTLDDARAAVAKHKATLAAGGDPTPRTKSKTRRRTAPPPPPPTGHTKEMTVGQLCDRFLRDLEPNWKPKTLEGHRLNVKNYIAPTWRDWPVSQLTYGVVFRELKLLAARKNATARYVYKTLSAVFSYGLILADSEPSLDRLGRHPLTGGKDKPGRKAKGRTRTFNNASLQKLVPALQTYGVKQQGVENRHHAEQRAVAHLLHLMLLTGQRKGEVRQMAWDDIAIGDDDTLIWTIPGDITKNGDEHEVPITAYVTTILEERGLTDIAARQHRRWVFPCRTEDGPLKDPKRAIATFFQAATLTHGQAVKNGITPHDLRRTVSAWLKSLGFTVEDRGRLLNHAGMARREAVVEQHYADHATPEHAAAELHIKRTMLERWNDHLYGTILGDEITVRRAKRAS